MKTLAQCVFVTETLPVAERENQQYWDTHLGQCVKNAALDMNVGTFNYYFLFSLLFSYFTRGESSKGLENKQSFNIFESQSTYSGVRNTQHKAITTETALRSPSWAQSWIFASSTRSAFTITLLFQCLPEMFSDDSLKHFE